MIVSGFRAALDLDTYPLSNLIRPRCAERAKPGRGKPVLIMHIGFFACFHAISQTQSFQQNPHVSFHSLVALKRLVSPISCLVACSAKIVVDKQTNKQTNRQRNRQTDKQTDKQTDRHTDQVLKPSLCMRAEG